MNNHIKKMLRIIDPNLIISDISYEIIKKKTQLSFTGLIFLLQHLVKTVVRLFLILKENKLLFEMGQKWCLFDLTNLIILHLINCNTA